MTYIQNPCLTRSELSLSKTIEMINVNCVKTIWNDFFPRGLTRPQQSGWPWRKIYCTGRLFLSFWGYFSTRTFQKNQRIEIHLGHGHKRGPKCFLYLWSSSGNLLYIFAFTATIQRIWKKMFREKTFFS